MGLVEARNIIGWRPNGRLVKPCDTYPRCGVAISIVQRPEGMRRRHWLNVEYVDRGTGDSRSSTLIKASSSTIGTRDALVNRAVGFNLSNSAAPTSPRVRLLNTKWIVRMS